MSAADRKRLVRLERAARPYEPPLSDEMAFSRAMRALAEKRGTPAELDVIYRLFARHFELSVIAKGCQNRLASQPWDGVFWTPSHLEMLAQLVSYPAADSIPPEHLQYFTEPDYNPELWKDITRRWYNPDGGYNGYYRMWAHHHMAWNVTQDPHARDLRRAADQWIENNDPRIRRKDSEPDDPHEQMARRVMRYFWLPYAPPTLNP